MRPHARTTHDTELLIIGAGPFGLSLAAYAGQHGVDYMLVGRPMEFWHKHMPRGMYLRSACDWHLDPGGVSTIARFLELRGQTIQSSMLNQVLSTVATITATPAAAVAMATNASLELTSAIGNVLKTSNDQHLDLFQGTYDATQAWISGDELNQGHGTEIIITHLA